MTATISHTQRNRQRHLCNYLNVYECSPKDLSQPHIKPKYSVSFLPASLHEAIE